MTVQEALHQFTQSLQSAGIGTARLDVLVLMEDITGLNKAQLLARPELNLTSSHLHALKHQINLRSRQLPLAYVRGKTEFYGHDFQIDQRVLEPRPESEAMIEELNRIISGHGIDNVIEIGTGSGALIIAAKLANPSVQAYATDISRDCLQVARLNRQRYNLDIPFFLGDLLNALPDKVWQTKTALIANLPYVPEDWQINPPAQREPSIAIFGGKDGLKYYRRLFQQIASLTVKPLFVLTEAMPPQHQQLASIAKRHNYKLKTINDFIQVFNYSAQRPA